MQWWSRLTGKQDNRVGDPHPESAYARRRAGDADIKIGYLELWIGIGLNQSWPWLDVAVRIGKGWGAFVDHHAPLVQRPDFIAWVPKLRAFVEGQADEVTLRSLGGSMGVTLRRGPHGLTGEAAFQHGPNSQMVKFQVWEDSLRAAVPQAEAVLARVEAGRNLGWRPKPGKSALMARASGIEPDAPPSQFEAWDSGLGTGGDVKLEYEVDGYGWYGVGVNVGDRSGEFGGGYLTDIMGDLLRAATALVGGARSAKVVSLSEPGQSRIEFERQVLRTVEGPEPGVPGDAVTGCMVRIFESDDTSGANAELVFEAVARSPRAVAEAIYRMAHPHFEHGAGPWSDAMAALEGALASVPRKAED
ncbi:MAG: hypothetical protein EOP62_18855 [Sphingomonadales bacterium]|nr:MAG: hypothetical protein EOP62_18855 [Sphingomonadales bacterium]